MKLEGLMSIDGAKYREILQENLLEAPVDLRLRQKFIFQQNYNPKHQPEAQQNSLAHVRMAQPQSN